jgi:hypothetical protein
VADQYAYHPRGSRVDRQPAHVTQQPVFPGDERREAVAATRIELSSPVSRIIITLSRPGNVGEDAGVAGSPVREVVSPADDRCWFDYVLTGGKRKLSQRSCRTLVFARLSAGGVLPLL